MTACATIPIGRDATLFCTECNAEYLASEPCAHLSSARLKSIEHGDELVDIDLEE